MAGGWAGVGVEVGVGHRVHDGVEGEYRVCVVVVARKGVRARGCGWSRPKDGHGLQWCAGRAGELSF